MPCVILSVVVVVVVVVVDDDDDFVYCIQTLAVSKEDRGSWKVTFFSPYWLVNKAQLTLDYSVQGGLVGCHGSHYGHSLSVITGFTHTLP